MSPVQGVASCSCEDTPKGTAVQSQWRDGKRTGVAVVAAVKRDVGEVGGKGWSGDEKAGGYEKQARQVEICAKTNGYNSFSLNFSGH